MAGSTFSKHRFEVVNNSIRLEDSQIQSLDRCMCKVVSLENILKILNNLLRYCFRILIHNTNKMILILSLYVAQLGKISIS